MGGFFFEFEAVRTESRDHDAPRRYFRCKIFFPLIVLVVVWINVSYWILKGTKGQCERFRTCRLTREAKAGNLWPALLVGLYPSIAAGVVAGAMVPTLSKRIDSGDVVGANKALAERAAAGVRKEAADEENTRDAEPAQKEEKKKSGMSYITGQLDRDTHKDLDTDAKVAARSRRPVVLWCFHFIHTTRLHQTRSWVVLFWIWSAFRARSRLDHVSHTGHPRQCYQTRP